jgi:murein DD-endopeptidase MepM/ murein hydrolase activator NlpD
MSLLQGFGEAAGAPRDEREASRQLEAMLLKQLLRSSGCFKGSDTAGASLHADLFAEALADAVAHSGGLGLADPFPRQPGPVPEAAGLPVEGRLTSGFGARLDPLTKAPSHHSGVDLATGEGTPIAAIGPGVVKSAGIRGGYGKAVEIDHGGGVTTLYAHASQLGVRVNEQVQPGQTIARVGHTGRSTGNHLHFEMRVNGTPVDPLKGLKSYQRRADEDPRRKEIP